MSSLYGGPAIPDERRRLLTALGVSLGFHALLFVVMAGVSLNYEPRERLGPMEVTFYEEPKPEPVPLPSEPPKAPARTSPAEAAAPRPAGSAPSARTARQTPAPETVPVPDPYAGLFASPADTSPAPGSSSWTPQVIEQPETSPSQAPRESGVIGSGSLVPAKDPAAQKPAAVQEVSRLDLAALDRALAESGKTGTGAVLVGTSNGNVSASLPGDTPSNQDQIVFEDGKSRTLRYSAPLEIPPSVETFGQPDFYIDVSFTVDSNGFLKDLIFDPPSVIPELQTAITKSMLNWRFSSSGNSGDVKAHVRYLIQVR